MSALRILQPPGWARAKGFSNGIAASGRLEKELGAMNS